MNGRKWALPFAVRWSSTAWQQYQDAMDFVAADKPQAALEQDASVTSGVARLGPFPKMGRAGRLLGTRELVVSGTPFIVVYRVQEEVGEVQVIRFLQGAQQWPKVE
ncbi:type II toxin-antitoxin system RelE/ParE family toxin [Acidithiobacillus thiooxidans]|jgi:toxin ParE1/3/4|uniref:type II toxin-antitoxin system RelE/ParE family toxin n=1 Tax=Acidithiobacillus thiooxidans TaxID=930 RepID=UPI001C07D695|nr:type II toxin-antitoxin system RelE/ParE family toxin [Acidithiobacillus thiooxidans]MBU2751099.1 type II toxin-antitoxin system RelE/ParE family toxin [Acidithiobacillus thiooxidans]MBU2795031.1 type II toxin-antitoxin system RelE/ParE family toxin [Acidithiobacillus thiooxidans]